MRPEAALGPDSVSTTPILTGSAAARPDAKQAATAAAATRERGMFMMSPVGLGVRGRSEVFDVGVDADGLAGDVVGGGRAEKERHRGHVVGRDHAAQRGLADVVLAHLVEADTRGGGARG